MLDSATLAHFCSVFAGYGHWQAPIWFVGIEEAGGRSESDVAAHLSAWHRRGRNDLEDAPNFYPASGNRAWHGASAELQPTWTQLIRMLLVAQGEADTPAAILNYQRDQLGTMQGQTCLLDLLPLPSPTTRTWHYREWSKLEWLQSREEYQKHMTMTRACLLARHIERHRPSTVVFYGSTWHPVWSAIAGGPWHQAIDRVLMGFERDNISFFVTKHPADPHLGPHRDHYFRNIGRFFHDNYGAHFIERKSAPAPLPDQ